ncbi:alpha/beta fold hydrolase [Saccharopolyspora hirsuta]|uniref:Thioesterase n=1 Tax=Saccharopolyspora hirsuta TaxID=1837 RepID=A0A5M7BYU5_SACHI|nr:alpha/beta fold hydrolase [Saccharopolyspora hirsuta]KAA5834949.1 thioesterase [Saccharopolyspora hirsuta]
MTATGAADAWIRRFHPKPDGRDLLACFPHAGGSASYYFPMSAALPDRTDMLAVQYPGRQERRAEPLIGSVDELADRATESLLPLRGAALSLFGHSLGASVAFEVARRLEQRGVRVRALFVSGRRPPSLHRPDNAHQADDRALVADLLADGGIPDAAALDPEIVQLVLPVVRNDLRAAATYTYRGSGNDLTCPVVALTGDRDPKVTVAEARGWASHTTGPFSLRVFPGGHFYLLEHWQAVVRAISDELGDR